MTQRLDVAMVERGLVSTRSKAEFAIKSGAVQVGGKVITKAGYKVGEQEEIICAPEERIRLAVEGVGRGAVKLSHALDHWNLQVGGVCVDVGASTGGFTQVLLERGADRVYAVDVGSAQLSESLRSDERVVSVENTDIRSFDLMAAGESSGAQVITCDVSFISLTKVLRDLYRLGAEGAQGAVGCRYILLIKPQYERLERTRMKRGVVKSEAERMRAVERVKACAAELGFRFVDMVESPIAGGSGNVEYLAYFTK